jgi:hypothetical protein
VLFRLLVFPSHAGVPFLNYALAWSRVPFIRAASTMRVRSPYVLYRTVLRSAFW